MKIYYDNQVDNATVTSPQLITNYPPSNVKNSILTKIYKGAEYSELQVDAGGGLKNISDAYTNLVQDPTDLTTGNWTQTAVTVTDSGESLNGLTFWKVQSNGGSFANVEALPYNCTSSTQVVRAVARKSDTDDAAIILRNNTGGSAVGVANIVFSTKTVTMTSDGTLLKAEWLDDDTVSIVYLGDTGNITIGDGLEIRLSGSRTVADTTSTLWTQPQITEGSETMYPFISGSKSADTITESFTMPDKFTFDMVVTPFFDYTSSIFHKFISFYVDSNSFMRVQWNTASDTIDVRYQDNTNNAAMSSQKFDDGTSFTNINQKIRIVGSMDTKSGANTSRFIVLPLESGSINEDVTWNLTPDIKSTSFPTISIGHESNIQQANSEYEYLRIYEGLLVGTVSSSSDVDTLLEDKKVLFDKTYQNKITATDLLLANTTINDGDTILLRANDVDSFNAGTPVDEVVTWDKNIIHHNFTKASHQYWWLSVNSSNAVEIGRMFLGESYTPPGIGPTVSKVRITADVKSKSVGGSTYGDGRFNYWQFITTFPASTHDQAEAIENFFDSVTTITPFFIEFDEECSDLERFYVTMDQDEVRFTTLSNPNYYTASINYIEET